MKVFVGHVKYWSRPVAIVGRLRKTFYAMNGERRNKVNLQMKRGPEHLTAARYATGSSIAASIIVNKLVMNNLRSRAIARGLQILLRIVPAARRLWRISLTRSG